MPTIQLERAHEPYRFVRPSPIPYIIYIPVIPMKLTLIASRQVSFSSCFPLLSSSDDSFLRGSHQTPRLSKRVCHYCLLAHNPVDKECKSATGRLLSCSVMLWRSIDHSAYGKLPRRVCAWIELGRRPTLVENPSFGKGCRGEKTA